MITQLNLQLIRVILEQVKESRTGFEVTLDGMYLNGYAGVMTFKSYSAAKSFVIKHIVKVGA